MGVPRAAWAAPPPPHRMADSSFLGGARTKAGMPETGGLERQRIDEIIQEASRGSKFYEHQLKREKRVQDKIEKLKAKKMGLEKMFARDMQLWNKNVKEMERWVAEMESQADFTKTIVCIDMDAFFAAVEHLEHPEWAQLPMAVGGKSMLCTANYEARKFGVVSAMPGYIALKLCPQLLIVEPNFEKYRAAADKFHPVFKANANLDEATLDITERLVETGMRPEDLVSSLRTEVFEASQLTCSAGIAPNKMLAKVASNMNKPNGQFYLPNDRKAVDEFIKGTRLAKINGIGKVTAKILEGTLGATTAGQLWEQRHWVRLLFTEIQADFLLRCAMGLGSNGHGEHEYERQSMSVERTFPSFSTLDRMFSVLKELCEELAKQLEMEGLAGKNVGIKMKASDFTTTTRAITLKKHVLSAEEMFSHAKQLLIKHHPPDLRLLGVRMSMLESVDEVIPEESIETFIVKMESESSAIKCPICLKPIASSEVDSERLVNEHVDLCLAKGLADEEEDQPKKKMLKVDPVPKPNGRPTLDVFFKRR